MLFESDSLIGDSNSYLECNFLQDEAQKKYIDLVNELAGKDPSAEAAGSASAPSTSEDILVEMQGKMQVIKLNRPNKKNALKVEVIA